MAQQLRKQQFFSGKLASTRIRNFDQHKELSYKQVSKSKLYIGIKDVPFCTQIRELRTSNNLDQLLFGIGSSNAMRQFFHLVFRQSTSRVINHASTPTHFIRH